MGGRRVAAGKAEAVRGLLAAGVNPLAASRAAGVSASFAYRVDREAGGGAHRMEAKRRRRAERARAGAAEIGRAHV